MDERPAGSPRRPARVAVLAGGRGSRLGGAKASVRLCGRPLIDYPLAAAREAGVAAVVVAKRDCELPPLREPLIHEPDTPRHPLCGLIAALAQVDAPVIAVGCDMPFVSAGMIGLLARAGDAATAPELDGSLQPLPALYRPADLPSLEDALERECSLRSALRAISARSLDEARLRAVGDPRRLCFSVNDPGDLRTARRWIEG